MTCSLGPLFHSNINNPEGWFSHECLIPGAELSIIDEQGRDAAGKVIPTSVAIVFSLNCIMAEGELVIKSHLISKGYLRFDSSAFTIGSDGAVTFRTGDIYEHSEEQRLVWKGRKEDYIQVRHIDISS